MSKTATDEDKITALYIGWTDRSKSPSFPTWIAISRITWNNKGFFYYSYTHGFKQNLDRLSSKIINPEFGFTKTWKTCQLDSTISSRIPHRPDSMKEYDYLGLEDKKGDFIAYLARSGGRSATDNYDIFPKVLADDQKYYRFYSYVIGLPGRVKSSEKVKLIADTLSFGTALEIQRTNSHTDILYEDIAIGYLPNYLHHLLGYEIKSQPTVKLSQVNYQNRRYARRFLVEIAIEFSQSPFSQGLEFKPLNPMPSVER